MENRRKMHHGKCHCGSVRFEVQLADEFSTVRRCTCSLCSMRGAVAVTAHLGDLKITEGEDILTLYQFNTKTAKHYFCSRCGIYTHHQRRSDPNQYGINVACIEGMSPFDFPEVVVNDGVNHPTDDPTAPEVVGILRFEKS